MKRTWQNAALGSENLLVHMQPGYACGNKDVVDGVVHLRMNNVTKEGAFDTALLRRIPRDVAEKQGRFADKGDVIFVNTNSTELVGKSMVFPGWSEPCSFSNHLTKLRVNPEILHPAWLHSCFRKLWHEGYFAAHCIEFIGQSTFNKKQLLELEVPVPPLAEQRCLVARIEALTSRLERARQARHAAFAEAQNTVAAAISSLLEERKASSVPLRELLSEQPRNGWSPPAVFQTGCGIPVLTLSAVTGFVYDGSHVKLTSAPTKEGAHYWLERGELLITRSNTPELVGHAAIYDGTPAKGICCDLIMKMRVDPAKADVRFVHYCLRSPAVRQFITQRAKGASGTMQKIGKQDVQEIPIPEIPITEQRRFVTRLDALAAKHTELHRLQTETEAELAAFTPALLAKAFRGEL